MVVVDFLRVTTLNCSSIVKAPKEQWLPIDVSSLIQTDFLSLGVSRGTATLMRQTGHSSFYVRLFEFGAIKT